MTNNQATHYIRTGNEELKGDIRPMTQVNHLENVCIMQKYNDSEKVLELRKEFKESEKYIIKAVNCHDDLVEALHAICNQFEAQSNPDIVLVGWKSIQRGLKALSKAESEPIK